VIRRLLLFASLFFVALASGGAFVVFLLDNPIGHVTSVHVATMQHAIRVLLPPAVALNASLVFTMSSQPSSLAAIA